MGVQRLVHRTPLPAGRPATFLGPVSPRCDRPAGHSGWAPRPTASGLPADAPYVWLRWIYGGIDPSRPRRLLRPDHLPGREDRTPARCPGGDRPGWRYARRLHERPRLDGRRAWHVAQVQLLRASRARPARPPLAGHAAGRPARV